MQTLKKIVLHPAAAVLALIPFVNLAYFVLMIVFAPPNKLFPYLFCVTVGSCAVFYLSNRFLPTGYELLTLYAVTVFLSAAAYFLLRPIVAEESGLPKSSKLRLAVGLAIVLFAGLMWIFAGKAVDLQPQTETMLQAIIDEDEAAFRAVSFGDELTLDSVQNALNAQDIHLRGAISCVKTERLTVGGAKGSGAKTAEFIYRIGDEEYLVQVTYRTSDTAEGISEIVIKKN